MTYSRYNNTAYFTEITTGLPNLVDGASYDIGYTTYDSEFNTRTTVKYQNVKFDETWQNIAKLMVLFLVICEGDTCEYRVVAPTKWASATLVHPVPKWSER